MNGLGLARALLRVPASLPEPEPALQAFWPRDASAGFLPALPTEVLLSVKPDA